MDPISVSQSFSELSLGLNKNETKSVKGRASFDVSLLSSSRSLPRPSKKSSLDAIHPMNRSESLKSRSSIHEIKCHANNVDSLLREIDNDVDLILAQLETLDITNSILSVQEKTVKRSHSTQSSYPSGSKSSSTTHLSLDSATSPRLSSILLSSNTTRVRISPVGEQEFAAYAVNTSPIALVFELTPLLRDAPKQIQDQVQERVQSKVRKMLKKSPKMEVSGKDIELVEMIRIQGI